MDIKERAKKHNSLADTPTPKPICAAAESLLSPGEGLAGPEGNIKAAPDSKSLPRVRAAGQEMGKPSREGFGKEGACPKMPLAPNMISHHVDIQQT